MGRPSRRYGVVGGGGGAYSPGVGGGVILVGRRLVLEVDGGGLAPARPVAVVVVAVAVVAVAVAVAVVRGAWWCWCCCCWCARGCAGAGGGATPYNSAPALAATAAPNRDVHCALVPPFMSECRIEAPSPVLSSQRRWRRTKSAPRSRAARTSASRAPGSRGRARPATWRSRS